MPSTFDFCLPIKATAVPDGPDWLHEVKYDGYRLRLERDGERVRLITRGGHRARSVEDRDFSAALGLLSK
jgi:ATP-dependent DNA ligase